MKKGFAMVLALLMCCSAALAQEAVDVILSAGTTQAFTQDAVAEEDLTTILQAGLNATSAINTQPWYFAVVRNQEVMAQIAGGASMGAAPAGDAPAGEMPEGAAPPAASAGAKAALGDSPVAVIIYESPSNMGLDTGFDCGLACQNMVIAANALGYGTKIVSSPTIALNGDSHDAFCQMLGVDTSMNAVAVLLIGTPDAQVDGVTGASTRAALSDKVSYVD